MAIPDFQSLMLPVLRRLAERQWKTAELVEAMADEHSLSLEERSFLLPNGRQVTIANRTHWALAYLNKAGLIIRVSRGNYEASARGRELLADPPSSLNIAYLLNYPEFAAFRAQITKDASQPAEAVGTVAPTGQSATPEERLEAAGRDLKAEVAATLLTRLQALSPTTFEQLIIDVMLKIGYGGSRNDAAARLGRSGDGGVDGVISEDVLGLDTIYLQAKRYAEDNTVGAPAIQGFAGALLQKGASKGVFVTTGRFSAQAVDVACGYTTHRIVLIDGRKLASLMVEHEVGVRTTHTIRVQRVALEAYEDGEAD